MRISELDLYKHEWLELVFANRNKQYGAYELRRTSKTVTTRALGIMLAFAVSAGAVITYASHHRPVAAEPEVYKIIEVDNTLKDKIIEHPQKKEVQPKSEPKQAAAKPLVQQPQIAVTTQKYQSMVAADDKIAEDVKPLKADIAIGPADIEGATNAINAELGGDKNGKAGGTGTGDAAGTEVYDTGSGLEVMPQPVGGDAAWAKFLQKHLRYPAIARENDQSGKVFISFIIERDGRLTDITVLRKAGFGFDEEALRVLKMAPAWKPGEQNGHAVRVRFTIPIGFQLASE